MKIKFIFLVLLAVSATAFAESQPPPQINVSGSAEVKVVPDEIHLNVAVESRDAALEPARADNDGKIAAALAFLKSSGVPDRDVQTDFVSIQPDYDYNRSRITPIGYIVRKSIEIKLTNIVAFQWVVTGLLTNGVNRIESVDFRTTELRKHRDHARLMAVRAAKEKAQALTDELGVKLGRPYSINASDNNTYWGSYNRGGYNGFSGANNMLQNSSEPSGGGATADNPAGTFAVGQISVTATVNVSFLIE